MFTLNDILQGNEGKFCFHGPAVPDPAQVFPAAQHDSRQVGRGDLFVAIKGAHVDGHRFIPAVAWAGAGAALCSEPADDAPPDFLQIIVPDVVQAIHATARVRTQRQENTIFIGITGSNGKTSTKEATAAVLSRQAPTLKTLASYNNEIGYPLTLLRLEPWHRYAVLEMGAQWVGELAWLCDTIARPDWSIITNVGAAHLEYFGTQERVIIAKSELVQALMPGGIAILNYDDVNVRNMSAKTAARVLYYGLGEGAAVRGSDIRGDAVRGLAFTLSYAGQAQRIQLRLPGAHGVIGPNGSTLIDDTYNANRQSIIAITAATGTAELAPGGKRWAVLGDIFELGQYAREEHLASGEALVGTIDYLVALGDQARFYVEGAVQAGMPEKCAYYFHADVENAQELEAAKRAAADLLKREVHGDDLVLIKGSRGMRMETMLEMLR